MCLQGDSESAKVGRRPEGALGPRLPERPSRNELSGKELMTLKGKAELSSTNPTSRIQAQINNRWIAQPQSDEDLRLKIFLLRREITIACCTIVDDKRGHVTWREFTPLRRARSCFPTGTFCWRGAHVRQTASRDRPRQIINACTHPMCL